MFTIHCLAFVICYQLKVPRSGRQQSSRKPQNAIETVIMASTTTPGRPGSSSAQKPRSRRNSRPNTPLRRSSRSELNLKDYEGEFPLDAVESKLQEFSDAFKDLEDNFDQMQMVHESLSRFNENFSSFLYGLNMNAFCVDFPEVSITLIYLGRMDYGSDICRPQYRNLFRELRSMRRTTVSSEHAMI